MNRKREIALGVECAWIPLPEPRRSSWLWIVFITLLVALGAWQLGRGAWIQAKAWLAQSLIAHAWARTLSGERQAKPWPWADTWPVARLTVPRLGIERYVLAGADGAAMAFGPGHVSGTPLPGEAGNSVIGGHRDTHLAFLAKDRREVWVTKQEGPARLTLVTCYPFDAWRAGGNQRYVLVAFLS